MSWDGTAPCAMIQRPVAMCQYVSESPSIPEMPHGNETLRVFGTKGFIESVDGGARTRLVTDKGVVEPLPTAGSGAGDYFDFVVAHLTTGAAMPLTLEEELHPLRMLLRAKEKLRAEGQAHP